MASKDLTYFKECENLEGWKYTKYFGIVTLSKVYQYMKIADIGISVLYPVKNREYRLQPHIDAEIFVLIDL